MKPLAVRLGDNPMVGILAAAACFSLFPLAIDVFLGDNNAFLFSAWVNIGSAVSVAAALMVFHRSLLTDKQFLALVGKRAFTWVDIWRKTNNQTARTYAWMSIGLAICGVGPQFFVWSTQFADTTIVAITQNLHSFIYILLVGRLVPTIRSAQVRHFPRVAVSGSGVRSYGGRSIERSYYYHHHNRHVRDPDGNTDRHRDGATSRRDGSG